ncbi:MAG: hypothetical protein ACR2HR_08670 [Euzebya sp.]
MADAFVRVIGMVDRPPALLHPRIMWRVLSGSRDADASAPAAA